MTEMVNVFQQILAGQPLSLALCAMNLLLLWFLFKQNNEFSAARRETMALVVDWQKESQTIMANAVSKEVMEMILKSLERDRETYRAMLPSYSKQEPASPQPAESVGHDRANP